MVYYDDDGNVIEERLRDETPPDERFMTSLQPETRPVQRCVPSPRWLS